jgi:hypothetical protein
VKLEDYLVARDESDICIIAVILVVDFHALGVDSYIVSETLSSA